jgi:hypothetical protein
MLTGGLHTVSGRWHRHQLLALIALAGLATCGTRETGSDNAYASFGPWQGTAQGACLSHPLPSEDSGAADCVVLLSLEPAVGPGACATPGSACDPSQALVGPGSTVDGGVGPAFTQSLLTQVCRHNEAAYTGEPGMPGDPDIYPICALRQVACAEGSSPVTPAAPGWCYATGAAAGACAESLVLSAAEPPVRAEAYLWCAGYADDAGQ